MCKDQFHQDLQEFQDRNLYQQPLLQDLYRKVSDKYDVYHIHVDHGGNYYGTTAPKSFAKVIGKDHVETSTVKSIAQTITAIVNKHVAENGSCTIGVDLAAGTQFTEDGAICW